MIINTIVTALTWYGYYCLFALGIGTLFAIKFYKNYKRFLKNNPDLN